MGDSIGINSIDLEKGGVRFAMLKAGNMMQNNFKNAC
jgi:hypothetical protein